jgi:DNA-binding response OmpR family regulator
MHMPDLTGLETLAALFSLVERLPTIFVTADRSRELMAKALEAGAFTLLHKPLSSGIIVITLNSLLGRYYREDAAGDRS